MKKMNVVKKYGTKSVLNSIGRICVDFSRGLLAALIALTIMAGIAIVWMMFFYIGYNLGGFRFFQEAMRNWGLW